MKKFIDPLLIAIAILLVGCQVNGIPATLSSSAQPTLTEAISLTPKIPPKVSPTPSPTPSATPAATSTPMLTLTPTIPPEARLQFECLEVTPNIPEDFTSSGLLIMENREVVSGRYKPGDYLMDMATGDITQINKANAGGIYFSVSPDRKLLAYSNSVFDDTGKVVARDLITANTDGERLESFPWEKGWVGIAGWLDDQHLVIDISGLDPEESHATKAASLLVLNPFTGERQILRPDFPGMYDIPPIPNWDGWSITKYDPTLTRVVYPRFTGNGYEYTYAIWDLSTNQLLVSLDALFTATADYLPNPSWSPDGSRFVVESFITNPPAYETFLVSRDGQIEQLTNLDTYIRARLSSYSWSPDGRYIAAWLSSSILNEVKKAELAILDTSTHQVTDYCLQITYGGELYGGFPPLKPIWSPDGKQLVVMDWYESVHRRVILVDVVEGFVAQIAEDMEPAGWMLAP